MYLFYYDGEAPTGVRRAPGFWRRLVRDVAWTAWPCAALAAGIVLSDWLTR